jgi:hypothetical protein
MAVFNRSNFHIRHVAVSWRSHNQWWSFSMMGVGPPNYYFKIRYIYHVWHSFIVVQETQWQNVNFATARSWYRFHRDLFFAFPY